MAAVPDVRLRLDRHARRAAAAGSEAKPRSRCWPPTGPVAGYFFGFLLNLSLLAVLGRPGSSIAYRPGLPFIAQWHRYLIFDASTSLGWDTGRAITTALAILIVGPAALSAFRRAARKANFQPAVTFAPAEPERVRGG